MLLSNVASAECATPTARGHTSAKNGREEEIWKAQHATAAAEDPILADTAALEGVGGTGERRIDEAVRVGEACGEGGDFVAEAVALRLACA